MKNNPYKISDWEKFIPEIKKVIDQINRTPLLSVGITPYVRITPSFFLDNYFIYNVKKSSDTDVIKFFTDNLVVLEDTDPGMAKRVNGTGFLINSPSFKKFIDSKIIAPTLVFDITTDNIVNTTKRLKTPFIGNSPKTFDSVYLKRDFRNLVKKLNLPSINSDIYKKEDFVNSSFDKLSEKYNGNLVVQRADKETGVSGKTFFIRSEEDLNRCKNIFTEDTGFEEVLISPFIEGYSTSMLGCITPKGVLTGPLQLQLIDVKEALHGVNPDGVFFGNDLKFKDWDEKAEKDAQKVVEEIGKKMQQDGYKGIFGIDFMYDKNRNQVFPNECNPRGTGSLLLHSLSMLEDGTPPLDFFHLTSHLGVDFDFDFELVNSALKNRLNYSNIAISPKGIPKMSLDIKTGVYTYNKENNELDYKRPSISLSGLEENDFLIIDTVPHKGTKIGQQFPRLFKFIFPYSISKNSHEIEERASFLVSKFSKALIKASNSN